MQNKKIADQMKRAPTEAGFLNEACALYRDESSPVDDPLTPFRLELDRLSGEADRSGIQVGCSVRNVALARFLAQHLIDSEGHFDPVENRALLSLLKHRLYSLEPNRQHDVARMEHITDAMQRLDKSKELVDKLNRIQKPFQNTRVEELIRLSLELPSSEKITDRLTRVAVLSAWLTYLRQSVGSCFATAPAIIVQTEMPEVFFDDLTALIHSCQLKRVIAGREHAVPMSLTWGVGELRRQFLLERTQDDSSQPIWCSPALQKAFTATGFVTIEGEREVRAEMTKEILLSLLSRWEGDGYTVQTSAEEIIRRFLMRHLELSRENISEVESRPEISLSALSGSISSSRSADLIGRYQRLQRLEEAAQNTFKIHSDHALLRTWEYTLASFAETKADFTKWNLYTSLGLDEKEPGGIGEALFHAIKRRLDACNEQVHDYTEQYETLYTRIKYLEVRLQRASNEEEGSYLKAEYRSLSQELQTLQELREQEHQKARRYSELFADLIEVFIALFPEYFQEVYDADLHEVDVGPYDDSPAGFRLLFKHGRSNPSAWTLVKTPAEYGDSLAQFFSMTETRITQHEHFNGLEEDISTIVSALVAHVRTTEFLENALHRMCKAHGQPLLKNPLDHLSAIEKKPWAYTSGGAMNTLVANYFGREDDPTEKSRWVENELELLTFLVDCVKEMPYKEEEVYLKDVKRSLLIHSPTHAFLFR
ncbi:MAG: hypothetical protein KDK40_05180, partial [Chlamydiia bacterium]|nr:hypothetical protein [Chlamydiia bacterium]